MRFFKKEGKIKNSIELVSLHIPKTAGTSFRNILKDVYGSDNVARLDIRRNIELNSKVLRANKIKSGIKVLHGHFAYSKLVESFDIAEGTPVVTWLREPAERVISNYFYLDKILRKELNEKKKDLNILAKMEKTLLEYAATEANRNRMSKFLDGISPDEFFFIGFTDHYEEDLADLARLLNWKNYNLHQHNITGSKPEVDDESLQKIRELNRDDYELYEHALQLREERLKSES
jgi:hypothetical protein